jgi:uncharacterized membrane protein
METSIFLARVIGLFGALSTLAILVRYKKSLEMEEMAARNPVILYLSGFVLLLTGILIVVSHQVWTADWRVMITIIGWLVFIKGLIRMFFPETVRRLIERKRHDRTFLLGEVAVLIASVYLLYQGFLVS